MDDCLICNRIRMIKEGTNPYFVAELDTGYVVIGDHQYFEGYTLFLCKYHIHELHLLDSSTKEHFLNEMSIVAEAMYNAFTPNKLNYEMLGNGDAHMHWHLFPRRNTEPNFREPVWWTDREIMYSDDVKPNEDKLKELKQSLLVELKKICTNIRRVGEF